jgi:hypothetical protein
MELTPQDIALFHAQIGITQFILQFGALRSIPFYGTYPLQFPLYHRRFSHKILSP